MLQRLRSEQSFHRVPLCDGCAQKNTTLTLVHANTTDSVSNGELRQMAVMRYPIPQRIHDFHSVLSESGQGPGGLSSDLGSKPSKSTGHCLQALRDQGSWSAQRAMQGCYRDATGTSDSKRLLASSKDAKALDTGNQVGRGRGHRDTILLA